MVKKVYINTAPLESINGALIKYMCSDRSDGKTTFLIRKAYDEYIRTGKTGILARRFVGAVSNQWITTLLVNLRKVRPNCGELTFKGSPRKEGVHIFEDGKRFATCIPLSRADDVKSTFDCDTHRNLYIDEYVPLNGRYLSDEITPILEIYRTIDRDDKFDNEIWVASNHITASNPLFREFGVIPRDGISLWKNGRFALLQVANKGNRNRVMNSPLGELIAGTRYAEYAAGGTLNGAKALIQAEHEAGRLPFCVRCGSAMLGFYYAKNGLVIDYTAQKNQAEAVYLTQPTGGKNGGIYLKTASGIYAALRQRYHLSEVFYASERVYEDAEQLRKLLEK